MVVKSYGINDIYWRSVDFNVIGQNVSLKKTPIVFDNGLSFNFFEIFKNYNDLKFNNKSGLVLTDLKNYSDVVIENQFPSNQSSLKYFESPIFTDTFYFHLSSNNTLVGDSNPPTTNDNLRFILTDDGYVLIENINQFYLTYNGNNLVFQSPNAPSYNNQKFSYSLGLSTIFLYVEDPVNPKLVLSNTNNNYVLQLESFDPTNNQIPYDSVLSFYSYINPERTYNSVVDSFTVKYDANPLLNQKNLSIKDKLTAYDQNFLCIFPSENYSLSGESYYFDFYFHGLKNYQSYDYTYTNNNINRIYDKIFTGTNQTNGLDNVFLSYSCSSVKVYFPTDTLTGFYYSPNGVSTPIQKAGLIQDGATASQFPYTSDHIYTSQKSNFKELQYLNTVSTTNSDNRYVCTWLKGSKSGDKIWYDRYYNSAYYTLDQAMSASSIVYNDKYDSMQPYVYDVPSTCILEPGSFYQYFHVGKQTSNAFLTNLEYGFDYQNDIAFYTKVLSISSWTQNPLLDNSTYHNNGIAYEDNVNNLKGYYWNMDGTNYAVFPANNSILPTKACTISMWLNVNDWGNINGYQIFGNYYSSGFGLICDNKVFAPTMCLMNNALSSSVAYNLNYRFSNLSRVQIPNDVSVSFDFVQKFSDLSYWVFDSNSFESYYFGPDDKLIFSFNVKYPGMNKITQVETDSQENIYIYDNSSYVLCKISKVIDPDTGNITGAIIDNNDTVFFDKKYQRFEIDLNDVVQPVFGNASVIDNNNVLWQVIGANLYKQNVLFATVGNTRQMICDRYNNIWLISESDSYTKINSVGEIEFTYSFSKSNLPDQSNCPPPPDVVSYLKQVLDEDLPFLSTNVPQYILDNYYEYILVDQVLTKKTKPKVPITERIRSIDMVNIPFTSTTYCGTSAIPQDNLIIVDCTDNEAYIIDQNGTPLSKITFDGLTPINEILNFKVKGDFTGYQNIRKFFNSGNKNNISWKFKYNSIYGVPKSSNVALTYDVTNLPKGWHMFSFVFDSEKNLAKYYIDSVLVDSKIDLPPQSEIYYDYRTSLLLGMVSIKNTNLNDLLGVETGYKFIGGVAELNMYQTAFSDADIEQMYLASRFSPQIRDLRWNMSVGNRSYIEEIKHWFQFQLPTNKSKYYNINIHNFNVDDQVKNNVELAIRNIMGKISPAHTMLYKLNWK